MKLRPVLACLCAAVALPGHAARPLQTDDAGVIGAGRCELEGSRSTEKVAEERLRDLGVALACGIGWDSQLGVAHGQSRLADAKAYGAALLGKTSLWSGEGDGAPGVAASWALGWAKGRGTGWEREGSDLRLIGTLPLGPVFAHANLGHLRERASGSKSTTWGLALESEPLQAGPMQWAPMAELYGDDHGDRWAAAGLRFTVLPERLFVDVALARQHSGDKARSTSVGFKFAF